MTIDKTVILECRGVKLTSLVAGGMKKFGIYSIWIDLGNICWDYLEFFDKSSFEEFEDDLTLEERMEIMELGFENIEVYRISLALIEEAKRLGLWK